MSVADLKQRMTDVPGIEALTMRQDPATGWLIFTVGEHVATTAPRASDQEIETAIRNALRLPSVALIPDKPKEQNMSVTGASHVGLSLKARMKAIQDKISQGNARIEAGFSKMEQAAEASNALGANLEAEANELLSTIGQFTNGAPE